MRVWRILPLLGLAACGGAVAHLGAGGGSPSGGGAGGGGGGGSGGGSIEVIDSGAVDAGPPHDAGVDAGPSDAGAADAGRADAGVVDRDGDGLADALEDRLALDYLPQISFHPLESCSRGGIVYRARPHPQDPSLVYIVYDYLLEKDCGLNGHVGDAEVFAITVNPAKPAPSGITALKSVSHQHQVCERTTTCGTCGGLMPCDLDGSGRPIMYPSLNKHGMYARKAACSLLTTCLDDCGVSASIGVELVNAGEPSGHLVEDLTAGGFVTVANGWTEMSLFHFNPWQTSPGFGGGGAVGMDMVDPVFETAPCR